ncbi:MAG: hypothetical protein QF570_22355 [Myxococcota bacterium]|jgi:hypothetical protein|nr:hypothetical protein [Myxococcota bacterium]
MNLRKSVLGLAFAVTTSSTMQDENGRILSISHLNSINGNVSFTMRESGAMGTDQPRCRR